MVEALDATGTPSATAQPASPRATSTLAGTASPEVAAAFTALHAEVATPLWRYLARASGDAALADDLLQESLLRLLREPEVLVGPRPARPYLYRIATNLLRDRWRAAKRHRRLRPEPAPERVPSHARAYRLQGDIQGVLDQLSERDRSLVWLAHVDGYSHQEIAEILGLRPASIKVLLHRAKKKLLALLEEQGYDRSPSP